MQKWPTATHEPIATVCANKTLSSETCGSLELYRQPLLANSWPRFLVPRLKARRGLEIREQRMSRWWAWVLLIVVPSREEICDCLLQIEHSFWEGRGESMSTSSLQDSQRLFPKATQAVNSCLGREDSMVELPTVRAGESRNATFSLNTIMGGIYLHLSFSCVFGVNRNSLHGKTQAARALSSSKCCQIPFLSFHQAPPVSSIKSLIMLPTWTFNNFICVLWESSWV